MCGILTYIYGKSDSENWNDNSNIASRILHLFVLWLFCIESCMVIHIIFPEIPFIHGSD